MELRLWNTLGRTMQPFQPLKPGVVSLYCCGPTVYNYAHIGNLRTYVFEDILRRTLEYAGYSVNHVMNITDVGHLTDDGDEGEDKMMLGARQRNMTVWEIARFFEDAFFTDTDALQIKRPQVICRATEHIEQMQRLIERLEKKGHTYQAGGNVYYSIDTFPNYGRLALLDRQNLQDGARIRVDEHKRNPRDFVLWFTRGKFEHQAMQWESPWGRGYPGWHIECSAMSMEYLGEQFDIHCGGVDHISVHHSNEIAQSDGATGHTTVRYWLHGEYLIMDSGRMGKSEGNSITLATLRERGFDPLDYRYYLLGAHYRSQLRFSWDALDAARTARRGLVDRLRELAGGTEELSEDLEPSGAAAPAHARIREAIADDLNVTRALGELRSLIGDQELSPRDRLALAFDLDKVLGLQLHPEVKRKEELESDLWEMIREREQARASKEFARADELREALRSRGIAVEDTASGSVWRRL